MYAEHYPANQLVYTMDGEGTPDCFAPSGDWTDTHTPRTECPPQFYRLTRLDGVGGGEVDAGRSAMMGKSVAIRTSKILFRKRTRPAR